MPRSWGLALGAGGLRGAAHVGILKGLRQYRLYPQMVAGSSAGSIIGALYAVGMPLTEMERHLVSLQRSQVYDTTFTASVLLKMAAKVGWDTLGLPLALSPDSPLGFIAGDKLEAYVKRLTGGAGFEGLRTPLLITAVDLENGDPVVFCPQAFAHRAADAGWVPLVGYTLAEAVRASTAIPGIFAPKRLDGRLLVDGGLVDHIPAPVLRHMGLDTVIAVNLLGRKEVVKTDNLLEILVRSMDLMSRELNEVKLRRAADLVISPEIGHLGLTDFARLPRLVAAGEEACQALTGEILRIVRE
ncbi:MAG: patatin-like phospholipase family protein [Bacillota bacterium]